KLMTHVPEFFKNQEESSQESPDSKSGFTPPPPPDHATPSEAGEGMTSENLNGWLDMPMVDGSGSVQRIPSADAIQGQMEQAMNGYGKTLPHPTPTRAQVELVASALSDH